jgi:hypothetical protein
MKLLRIYLILYVVLSLQSCEIYGPASRFQTTKQMETPYFNGEDTISYYVSGCYGSGLKYKPNDGNQSGSLSFHYSQVSDKNIWTRKWMKHQYRHFAIGGFGMLGQYQVNDSLNLSYHALGFRGEFGNHLYTPNGNTDFSFTLTFGRNYENGPFLDFRQDLERKKRLNLDYSVLRWSTDLGFRWGIKHRFEDYKIATLNAGMGWHINNDLYPYIYGNVSYQFNKKIHITLNTTLVSNKNGKASLSDMLNLGITYGFHSKY